MQASIQLLVCLALIPSTLCHTNYLNNTKAGVAVGVSTHSGSQYTSRHRARTKDDLNVFNLTMVRIRELTATGEVIRVLDFTKDQLGGNFYNFTEASDVDVGDGQKADTYTVRTYIEQSKAIFESKIYLLTGMGYVPISGENVWAYYGRVFYQHTFHNWEFCNPCNDNGIDQNGARLELMIKVRAHGFPNIIHHNTLSKNLAVYDMGDGGTFYIGKKIHVDGQLQPFPVGYPDLEAGGDITIAFPKFNNYATYDALYRPGSKVELAPNPCPPVPEPGRPSTSGKDKLGTIDFNIKVV